MTCPRLWTAGAWLAPALFAFAPLLPASAAESPAVKDPIRMAVRTGLAGCSVEDFSHAGGGIYDPGLARERVAVTAIDERAAVVVANMLGDQFGFHAGACHQRDRGVAEPVEAEIDNDDRAPALVLFLWARPPASSAGSQIDWKPEWL